MLIFNFVLIGLIHMLLRSALYCADVQLLVCCFSSCLTHQFGIKVMWNRGVWYADMWYRRKSRVVSKSKFKFNLAMFGYSYYSNYIIIMNCCFSKSQLTQYWQDGQKVTCHWFLAITLVITPVSPIHKQTMTCYHFPTVFLVFSQENVHCVWHQIAKSRKVFGKHIIFLFIGSVEILLPDILKRGIF